MDIGELTPKTIATYEVRDLTHEAVLLLNLFTFVDGICYVRCSDGRMRPVDSDTAWRLKELRWSQELIDWKLNGRTPELQPVEPSLPRNSTAWSWVEKLRIMFGRK